MTVKEEQVSTLANQAFDEKCILSHSGSCFSKVRTKTNEQLL